MALIPLGDKAPNFTADSSLGAINFTITSVKVGGILFSHPADLTPVCKTELGTAAKFKDAFDKRNVKILALSVDGAASHTECIKDINEVQNTTVNFPIIADEGRKVSHLYDMVHPNPDSTLTVRSIFIIAPDKTVKLTLSYPDPAERDFHELPPIIDSLQLTAYHKVAAPANWSNGQDVVVSQPIKTADAQEIFTKGAEEIKPHLRMAPDPSK